MESFRSSSSWKKKFPNIVYNMEMKFYFDSRRPIIKFDEQKIYFLTRSALIKRNINGAQRNCCLFLLVVFRFVDGKL